MSGADDGKVVALPGLPEFKKFVITVMVLDGEHHGREITTEIERKNLPEGINVFDDITFRFKGVKFEARVMVLYPLREGG